MAYSRVGDDCDLYIIGFGYKGNTGKYIAFVIYFKHGMEETRYIYGKIDASSRAELILTVDELSKKYKFPTKDKVRMLREYLKDTLQDISELSKDGITNWLVEDEITERIWTRVIKELQNENTTRPNQ